MATTVKLSTKTNKVIVKQATPKIKLTNSTPKITIKQVGSKGQTGDRGIQGEQGDTGLTGKSAYELAVIDGFEGTLTQWLDSLKSLDKTFSYDFTAQAVVTVTHNLGKLPSVNVIDTAGDEVQGEVYYTNVNEIIVSFSYPTSGRIICN
jgi:hypothetical protein